MGFANLAGAWALVGLVAVVAIHLLRRQPRRVVATTLFLVPPTPASLRGGRRVERLRSSAALWLQLAAVALLALALLQPFHRDARTRRRVAVVLDASASMTASREAALAAVERRTRALADEPVDWLLRETTTWRPALYAGTSGSALVGAVSGWQSCRPGHDFGPVLVAARTAVGSAGDVVLVTDRPADVPAGVEVVQVGQRRGNVGFAGVTLTGDASWRALVRSWSDTPERREAAVTVDGKAVSTVALDLAPGELRVLDGTFPPQGERVELRLTPDALPLDDMLPLVRPRPKPLIVHVDGEAIPTAVAERLRTALAPATLGDIATADLVITRGVPPAARAAVVLRRSEGARLSAAPVLGAADPLTDRLSWDGLLVPETAPLAVERGDRVLLWQSGRAIGLRRGRHLHLAFDTGATHAERLPAFVLLLARFAESVRAEKVAFAQVNAETAQALDVASRVSGPPPQVTPASGDSTLRAPCTPGFFDVRQGDTVLLTGAAHLADPRESDLRGAASREDGVIAGRGEAEEQRRPHPLGSVALLAAGALFVLGWIAEARVR